ncbi:hypothetical protein [Streptomyces sp. NPDC097619]|uniref:SCO0607 family lipoprotein n=1 Tax=Streptomyces sp. NPDC097619 TaxID=3157228 RepID=UPI003329790F
MRVFRAPGRSAVRSAGSRAGLALLLSAATVLTLTSCAGFEYREDICGGGHYPVLAVGNTGSDCVPDDREPPEGFVRYPAGKVPQQVDDQWDVYWRTRTIDRDGNVVPAPTTG